MTDRTTKPKPTGKSEHVTVRVSDNVDAEINKADFDRMMDDSYEDLLRFSRDILKRALKDDRTPANAVANIAKELLNVGRELDAHSDQDILTSLDEDESEDVDDGIRTEII
jgi:plasmid stability protein